jgi:hypothetical protein
MKRTVLAIGNAWICEGLLRASFRHLTAKAVATASATASDVNVVDTMGLSSWEGNATSS